MDRIQDLRLFVRVVDLGSFSKAAAEAGIGQPGATKLINRMEKQLGARLLHRTTHGVSPTEIGLLYYDKCKLICHHAEEAESVSALLQQQAQGAIRISTSVAFGRRVMAPLVMEFMRMNPQLQNPGMVFHPPMLYLGYISITIPFAPPGSLRRSVFIQKCWG